MKEGEGLESGVHKKAEEGNRTSRAVQERHKYRMRQYRQLKGTTSPYLSSVKPSSRKSLLF
jgi:hypothetical protein